VKSATHLWSGLVAVKSRRSRSGARTAAGSGLVVRPLLGPGRPAHVPGAHQPGQLVPAHVDAGAPGGLGQLAPPIDRVVLLPQFPQLGPEFGVAASTGRRWPGTRLVIGGRGDLQCRADRLDPPPQPTGLPVPVGRDERHYLRCRRPGSAPEKLAAACRISLARRSSAFSRRSRLSSAASSLATPGHGPRRSRPASPTAAATRSRFPVAGQSGRSRPYHQGPAAGSPAPGAPPAPSAQAGTASMRGAWAP
jgi:hypothetical protein